MTGNAVTVGVDLGGTGTRLVGLDAAGTVLRHRILPTWKEIGSPDALVDHLATEIHAVAEGGRLGSVGIGASGPVDPDGIIRNDATLPAHSHIPLTDMLTDRLGVGCVIDNDAVTAAIGEHAHGAGRGSSALLMITLGTGIGAALLTDGIPTRGGDGRHPEMGHIPVPGPAAPCYCGLPTCWEQLASRKALDALTADRTDELARRARAGDRDARGPFETYGERVGIGMCVLATVLRPTRIVFGGSAAQYLPLLTTGLDRALTRATPYAHTSPYTGGELGALSGAVGGAVLARDGGQPGRTAPV